VGDVDLVRMVAADILVADHDDSRMRSVVSHVIDREGVAKSKPAMLCDGFLAIFAFFGAPG
jgi:hypothetical protein